MDHKEFATRVLNLADQIIQSEAGDNSQIPWGQKLVDLVEEHQDRLNPQKPHQELPSGYYKKELQAFTDLTLYLGGIFDPEAGAAMSRLVKHENTYSDNGFIDSFGIRAVKPIADVAAKAEEDTELSSHASRQLCKVVNKAFLRADVSNAAIHSRDIEECSSALKQANIAPSHPTVTELRKNYIPAT